MQKIKCLSEIYLLIEQLPKPNQEIIKEAKEYQNQLTKPPGSLGILENLSIFFVDGKIIQNHHLKRYRH